MEQNRGSGRTPIYTIAVHNAVSDLIHLIQYKTKCERTEAEIVASQLIQEWQFDNADLSHSNLNSRLRFLRRGQRL